MLTNITSLTGNGLRDWLVQRVTSVIITVYIFFLLGFMLAHTPLTFEVWHGLFQHTAIRIFSLLFLLSLLLHSWVGVWTITTDYLPYLPLRLTCQILVFISLIVFLVWGIIILWGM